MSIEENNMSSDDSLPVNEGHDPQQALIGKFDDNWLQSFYKEAGREATLAYTTLNQMKNWAMVVAAAALSGLPFGSRSSEYPNPIMFAGTVIVYTFILRFFVRAIICYTNLIRWNVLQNDCVQLRLLPSVSNATKNVQQRETTLRQDIQDYYFRWLSPLSRKDQLFQNLKLGFYLLFGLALFFMFWGAIALWHSSVVKGLFTFAILNTALEIWDFSRSKYFDDPEAFARRKKSAKEPQVFPLPHSQGAFFVGWVCNVIISISVALWPAIKSTVMKVFCR
jgi:hypothetical protein